MHFRRRGNNVQLVKTQPGEGGGKAVSKPVGSANLASGEIHTKDGVALTAEETAEVKAWIGRHQAIEKQKRELDYRLLPDTLVEMATWIRDADKTVLDEHAAEVRNGLQRVRASLERALGDGEPKKKRTKEAA